MSKINLEISPEKLQIIGWIASLSAILMYMSMIDQIRLNLAGNKGSIILPIATIINCLLWSAYSVLRTKIDKPILIANIPGIVLGIITLITAW